MFTWLSRALLPLTKPITWAARTKHNWMINVIVLCLVSLSLFLAYHMSVDKVPDKFSLTIDNATIHGTNTVTVGEGSQIEMKGVPRDYLTVRMDKDSVRWSVNPLYMDSLQYVKINNSNPNSHLVDKEKSIHVELPERNGMPARSFDLSGKDVYKTWEKFEKQENVMLRHFIAKQELDVNGVTGSDSTYFTRLIDDTRLHSFLNKKGDEIKLIILDRHTTVDGEGYRMEGGVGGSLCKIQFHDISSYCFKENEGSEYFQISGVNYVMKPTVRLTTWGAGHLMLERKDKDVQMFFPKAITYVGTVDTLRTMASHSGGMLTFKQTDNLFPTKSDLYLPRFSGAANIDVCNLEMKRDSLVLRDSHNKETVVSNPTTPHLPVSITPAFQKVSLRSGGVSINARTGFVDRGLMLSFIWVPLAVLLVLVLLIMVPKGAFRPKADDDNDQIRAYPRYMATMLYVAFGYCVCKSLIAMKLSYTFPYFEKISAITPFNTSMLLLMVFTLALIINFRLVSLPSEDYAPRRKCWGTLMAVVAIFAGLLFVLFRVMDVQISESIIRSYFPDEIEFFSRWWKDSSYGTFDNHRTVSYMLIAIETILILIVAALNIFGTDWMDSLKEKYGSSRTSGWKQKFDDFMMGLINGGAPETDEDPRFMSKDWWVMLLEDMKSHLPACGFLIVVGLALWLLSGSKMLFAAILVVTVVVFLADFVHDALVKAFMDLAPWHFVLLLLLIVVGQALGNFGTAFISLGVILGYTNAISRAKIRNEEDYANDRSGLRSHAAMWEMVMISLIYIAAAMVADNGYMTNYLGFAMFFITVYFVMMRPGYTGLESTDKRLDKEKNWVTATVALVIVLIMALPVLCSNVFNPENVNYSRMSRRINLYSNFDVLQKQGFRYTDSDAEFMVVMSHYMQEDNTSDPLSNDLHPLHPSVSTGQSPVVLNDLSVPAAFVAPYGAFKPSVIYFLLMTSLLLMVINFSFMLTANTYTYDSTSFENKLTPAMQWRLLAVYMWIGTSLYIYFSYLGRLPFTGRLNPGFGVDAVGEAIESAFLLAFMLSISVPKRNEY